MKKIILAILVTTTTISFGQKNEISINSDIDSATIYTNGALIHRSEKIQLKAGRNEIRFTEISSSIDTKSLQFSSHGKLELLSITSIDNHLIVKHDKKIDSIKDSIRILEKNIQTLTNKTNGLRLELDLLKTNLNFKGQNENISVEEIKAMGAYYNKRSFELNEGISDNNFQVQKINLSKIRLNRQLNELNYKEFAKSKEVIVLVDAPSSGTFDIHLGYVVYNCGWAANYDLTAQDINSSITLKYKAKVYNNTGNPWKDIKLRLSTADPQISASAPTLSAWYLNENAQTYKNVYQSVKGRGSYMVPQNYEQKQQTINGGLNNIGYVQNATVGDFEDVTVNTQPTVGHREIEVSALSSEFDIKLPYTIPSDSKPYIVEIETHELAATFSHIAIPKLDRDAFLLAKIGGWEKLSLVPGEVNVYFADNYVGQSFMNTRNVEDSLGLSFGRDKRILVTRSQIEEYSDSKVIGSNKKDTYAFEIVVKNNRSVPIELDLYDQVPISQNSEVSVTVNDITAGKQDETTGEVNWLVNLKPGESKRYVISFTIKYPKNSTIKVKSFRTISAPSF